MKRSLHVVVLAVLALLLIGPIPNSLAGPPGPRLKSGRGAMPVQPLAVTAGDAAGYGTGTILHADAVRQGTHSLVDLDVAFSGAAFSSGPVPGVSNEVNRVVSAQLDANAGRGRGTALELGLGSDPIPLIGQLSQASAPPSTRLIERVIGPLGVPGILTADLLRSQAQARARQNACVLGGDQAYGLGSVLNLNVLNGLLATVASPPKREVSQSASTTRIVPGSTPDRLGLRSETRQTIAPVTFFKGTPGQFTIEVLGEWALRATADGAKGSVSYGPLSASPETPVLRVLGDHGQVLGQLTTQQLLGPKGLEIVIPGVAEIVLGEDPRAIGGDASSNPVIEATKAAAAVDVVRVKLLGGALADVRVGHMEAAVSVPAGGVQCPGVQVVHTVDTPTVTPGQDFIYTITVTNPNDCDLSHLKLVETPTGTPSGVRFELVSATPPGGSLSGGTGTYPDIGPLAAGDSKTVKIKVKIPADSTPGKLTALAVATGVCPATPLPTTDLHPTLPGTGGPSPDDIPVRGDASVDGPTIGVCVVPDLKGLTPALAKKALEAAGCTLGDVTDGGPGNPADLGKVTDQGPKADTTVPLGTPVDITVGGPLCTVPALAGLTADQAKTKLEDAGCKLGTVTTGPTGNPEDAGKISTQTPPAGDKVPRGTVVDVVVFPPACVVPDLAHLTEAEAKAQLEKAGCRLGTVTPGPDNPDLAGKVIDQSVPKDKTVQQGTEVSVTVAGPVCIVPGVTGTTEGDARSKVETAGCVLTTEQRATTNPDEVGKVMAQSPEATTVLAKGSPVKVTLGVQVAGASLTRAPDLPATGPDTGTGTGAGTLVRTGGIALGGLALWLLISGLMAQLAGSERLWRLARRLRG
ncbi:MAG: eukaryotic-like serine/threonine-protein kinase [Actinomycetota bacterium]|nr:eukaryotic-like serine/threonine-protein kinase [Actinomycetota bacterium]